MYASKIMSEFEQQGHALCIVHIYENHHIITVINSLTEFFYISKNISKKFCYFYTLYTFSNHCKGVNHAGEILFLNY